MGGPRGAITALQVTGFRSHLRSRFDCDGQLVVIHGPNGSGKTAVLEAISMLAPGRGLRGQPDRDAIRSPELAGWHVRADLSAPCAQSLEAELRPGGRRRVWIDQAPATRGRLADEIRIAWLTPHHDRLWTDGAEARRRYLDRTVAAFFPEHASVSGVYAKAMRDRNVLLREDRPDARWLDALELNMAEQGVRISHARREALDRIRNALREEFEWFPAFGLRVLAAECRSPWERSGRLPEGGDEEWRQDDLLQALRNGRERDAMAGRTLQGPHRSELAGWLEPGGRPLRQASTGEQKGVLMSFVLAAARALSCERRPSVLLLDEVAAHLDPRRRAGLFAEIGRLDTQVWVTGVDARTFADAADGAICFALSKVEGASTASRAELAEPEG